MIPPEMLAAAAELMADDPAVGKMFLELLDYQQNPLVNAGRPFNLDPRVFNADTFERVTARAQLAGNQQAEMFFRQLAEERRPLDREQALVEEALAARRCIGFDVAQALFAALGVKTDDDVQRLRIGGYRLSQMLNHAAFALVRDPVMRSVA